MYLIIIDRYEFTKRYLTSLILHQECCWLNKYHVNGILRHFSLMHRGNNFT